MNGGPDKAGPPHQFFGYLFIVRVKRQPDARRRVISSNETLST